ANAAATETQSGICQRAADEYCAACSRDTAATQDGSGSIDHDPMHPFRTIGTFSRCGAGGTTQPDRLVALDRLATGELNRTRKVVCLRTEAILGDHVQERRRCNP